MTIRSVGQWSRWLVFAVVLGITIATVVGHIGIWVFESYVPPVTIGSIEQNPYIENGFIKVPADIHRDRECIATTMFSLRRMVNGREDIVPLGMFNTTLSQIGDHKILVWFRYDDTLPPGPWTVTVKVQDQCGNWFTGSTAPTRGRDAGEVTIPEGVR